jgi:histidine triad (HIT) family protein
VGSGLYKVGLDNIPAEKVAINFYQPTDVVRERSLMTEECLFCRIAKGQTDTRFLMQNETLAVFKDINPHAPVHLLIVPKKHIRSINDLTDDDRAILGEMIMAGKEMARSEGIDKSGYKLLFNVEKGGGQMVFHLHLHLLGGWNK